MPYCSKRGQEIPIEANFCPRCGTKTIRNGETNIPSKSDDIREVFNRIRQEFTKPWLLQPKRCKLLSTQQTENVQQSLRKELVACSGCGEKNANDPIFCRKCGQKMQDSTTSKNE